MKELSEIDQLVAEIIEADWPEGLEAERAAMEAEAPPLAADIAVDVTTLAGRPAERLVAPGTDQTALALYLHGGGYVYGSLSSHRGLVGELARSLGHPVLQLDYRLAPEHSHPAALDDAVQAVRELYSKDIAPDRLILIGDSAGAGLVLAALLALKATGAPMPRAAICLSPWTDLTCSGESYASRAATDPMIDRALASKLAARYADGHDLKDPRLSPLFGDLSGLPPLLIHVGEREVLFSDADMFATRAKEQGVDVQLEEWADMIHVWHLYFPKLLIAHEAIARIGAFANSSQNITAEKGTI